MSSQQNIPLKGKIYAAGPAWVTGYSEKDLSTRVNLYDMTIVDALEFKGIWAIVQRNEGGGRIWVKRTHVLLDDKSKNAVVRFYVAISKECARHFPLTLQVLVFNAAKVEERLDELGIAYEKLFENPDPNYMWDEEIVTIADPGQTVLCRVQNKDGKIIAQGEIANVWSEAETEVNFLPLYVPLWIPNSK